MPEPEPQALFDPKQYLQDYFLDVDDEFDQLYQFWCRAVQSLPAGGRALELGVGPSIYTAIPLASRMDEIHLADLLERNLAEIDAWMNNAPGSFDWTDHIRHVLTLEGITPSPLDIQHREEQLKSKIKTLRTCDLRWEQPLGRNEDFDLVTAHYCTEAASRDIEDWAAMIGRVVALVRQGGAFFLTVASGLNISRAYDSIESVIPPPNILPLDVKNALTVAGMRLDSWDFIPGMEGDPYAGSVLSLSFKPLEPISQDILHDHNHGLPSLSDAQRRDGAEAIIMRELEDHPSLGLEKGENGWWLVVQQPIEKDGVVFHMTGECVPEPTRYSLQIDEHQHLSSDTWQADDFIDHSCDPNCRIDVAEDCIALVAIQRIEPGEKLTFNYLTTEWDMAEPFDCDCGSNKCFKHIAGFRYLSDVQKKTLEPFLTPFLKRKLGQDP